MNTRAKGSRTFAKACRYAISFPGTRLIPIYQVSRFAQAQPFDLIVFRNACWPRLVEVRTNQWGIAKANTRSFALLPGEGFHRQIWRFKLGATTPEIRQWQGTEWAHQDHPWEGE